MLKKILIGKWQRTRARLIAIVAVMFSVASMSAVNDPVADPAAVVVSGNARFTVLTPEMIRIEYSDSGVFEDRATFAVINRNLEVPVFHTADDSSYLYITTDRLKLKYRKGTDPVTVPASGDNLSIEFDLNGKTETWYTGKPEP